MLRKAWVRRTVLTLFGIDLAVFLASWVPTTLGYVGSEAVEQVSLAAGAVSLVAGIVLLPFVAFALLGRRE